MKFCNAFHNKAFYFLKCKVGLYFCTAKMSENTPLSVQIEQYLELVRDQKAELQKFLDALNIYEHDPTNFEAQKTIRAYMKDAAKSLGTSQPPGKTPVMKARLLVYLLLFSIFMYCKFLLLLGQYCKIYVGRHQAYFRTVEQYFRTPQSPASRHVTSILISSLILVL